jgi:hypothetical protein
MGPLIQRYYVAHLTLLLAASLAYWPTILNPLAQAYIRLCSHSLRHLPLFLQHYPTLRCGNPASGPGCAAWERVRGAGSPAGSAVSRCRRAQRLAATRPGAPGYHSVFAFCLGLVSPRIYVSEGLLQLLDAHELAAVLHHEAAHLRRRDPLRLFLSELLGYLSHPRSRRSRPASGSRLSSPQIKQHLR